MKAFLAALVLLPSLACAQAAPLRVSVDSRGDDVREVIATLFAQAHRPYALDASIKGRLYVALDRMPFAKALGVVLTQAGLVAREEDGVTMIVPAPMPAAASLPSAAVVKKPAPVPASQPPKPSITKANLARRVTTRLSHAPLADVFATLTEQTRTPIELDPSVPAYRVDAFFVKSSLGYALGRVCKAAGLAYEVEEGKIVVRVR